MSFMSFAAVGAGGPFTSSYYAAAYAAAYADAATVEFSFILLRLLLVI